MSSIYLTEAQRAEMLLRFERSDHRTGRHHNTPSAKCDLCNKPTTSK